MIDVCKVIEQYAEQRVTPQTRVEDLNVDSLEYLDLLMMLGVDPAKEYETVADIEKAMP